MSTVVPRPASVPLRPPVGSRRRASPLEVLSSTDHKRIGLITSVTAFCFFLLGGALALTMRAELQKPGMQFLTEHTYNELFTMHGSTMFYLFAAPVVLGVGLYFVPLQIGAARLLWPRTALLGYWLFAAGGVLMYSGFLPQQGAASFGWTAYFPLSDANATPGVGVDFWVLAVILATTGALLQSVSLLGTIVRLRAPGMTMLRMPLFTWSELVTVFMVITGFPVLIVAMTLLEIDRQGGSIFSSSPEGSVTWQHLFWF